MLPILLTILGCQKPFDQDRHDLVAFRIAGVSAAPTADGQLALHAFVYGGAGLYHDSPLTLTWTAGDTAASGVTATVPVSYPLDLTLHATNDAGNDASAGWTLDRAPTPPLIAATTRGATDLTLADAALPIEDRLAHTVGDDVPIAAGGSVRLGLDLVDAGDRTTHWMTVDGDFRELDPSTTDWFAGRVTIDDDEVVASEPVAAGVYPLVALVFDGQGGDTWTWLDAGVDVASPLLHVGGRLFPVDTALAGAGWYAATITSDGSLAGYSLTDLTPADDPAVTPMDEPVCGQPVDRAFDPAAIAEGVCTRAELEGARIVVSGEVRP